MTSDFGTGLVIGFGITGRAVAQALRQRGNDVIVVDDHPSPAARRAAQLAAVELVEAPSEVELAALVGAVVVVLSDVAGQHLLPVELPVGVVTAAVGAPYLLWLLVRSNRAGVGG